MPSIECHGCTELKILVQIHFDIDGVNSLHGSEFTIGPDYLEVVSFIGAAAVTHGEITV